MQLKDIKELVKTLEKSSLNELYLKDGEFELSLIKNREKEIVNIASAPQQVVPQTVAPVAQSVQTASQTDNSKEQSTDIVNSNLKEIKSPMVGTFYKASSPDAAPFVKEGDTVSEDTVVCIVEAMKLFNEIKAEISGKIVKVLVEDGQPVEYGQPLFLVE